MSVSAPAYAADTADLRGASLSESVSSTLPADVGFMPDLAEGDESFQLTAEKVSARSAVLSWSSESVYMSYTLCRYNAVAEGWEAVLVTADSRAKLNDLSAQTEYRYAVMNSADGKILGAVAFTTGIQNAVVKVSHVSSKAVDLTVKHVDDNTVVSVYRSEDGKRYEKIGEADHGRFTDTEVKEATTYYYKVKCLPQKGAKGIKPGKSTVAKATTLKSFGLPKKKETQGECKTYAYYTAVTAKRSPQYKLLRSKACTTDEETGIRMVDGCYCVALGSYYGKTIGTKYRITLLDGDETKEINVILCDQKSDRHTDAKHQYARRNRDVVEFYVEKHKIPSGTRGDYGRLPQFSGKIVAIEQYVED